jgi:hypothetical protein
VTCYYIVPQPFLATMNKNIETMYDRNVNQMNVGVVLPGFERKEETGEARLAHNLVTKQALLF